jgi:hypothetical protein
MNMRSDTGQEEPRGSDDWLTLLGAAAALIAIAIIVFVAYRIHYRDNRSEQANNFATNFISNSPVVESRLGKVEEVKEIKELHQAGTKPGWYLDYNVTGNRASGVVDMRLTPSSNYDLWNVPLAQLDVGHRSVTLR